MLESIIYNPLFGLLITLVAFAIGQWCYKRSRQNAFMQPIVVGITLVIIVLLVVELPFDAYFKSAYPLHLMAGPVTVALAVPLYKNIERIKTLLGAVIGTLIIGSTITVCSCIAIAWLLGSSDTTLFAMTTKSITTPIAMAVADKIGATAALAAPFVMFTGAVGAVIAPWMFTKMGIEDDSIKGICLGLTSHAIGTGKAIEISSEAGAFAALSMGLTGILTAIILPFLL